MHATCNILTVLYYIWCKKQQKCSYNQNSSSGAMGCCLQSNSLYT